MPTSRLACPRDWFRLPKVIRDKVWAGYRNGSLSGPHLAAITEAQVWWEDHRPATRLPDRKP